jgi:hypothetical protein
LCKAIHIPILNARKASKLLSQTNTSQQLCNIVPGLRGYAAFVDG